MDNISIVLDEVNWTFCPKYKHELNIKKAFLEDALGKLMYIKQNIDKFPKKMADEIIQEFPKVVTQITDLNKEITPEILAEEIRINETYVDKTVLGIFVEEILKKDLPKPVLSPADEENKKNIINNTKIIESTPAYDIESNVTDLFISDNTK